MMRKRIFLSLCILFVAVVAQAATITKIDFQSTGSSSDIEIKGDTALNYEKIEDPIKKQVILNFKGASIDKLINRPIDTSNFNGPITLITPDVYSEEGGGVKIIFQLKEDSTPLVAQDGSSVRLAFANIGASSSSDSVETAPEAQPNSAPAPMNDLSASAEPEKQAPANGSVAREDGFQSRQEIALEDFLVARKTQRFDGKKITLQLRDVEILDALRLIADASGFNIVLGDGVTGKITISMTDVPWDQALDVILQSKSLGAERNKSVLRIVPLTQMIKEKQEELAAQKATEAAAPKVTKVFPISYADPASIQKVLQDFSSKTGDKSNAIIHYDQRTNSIVVQDIMENIERMRRLVQILDTQVPQVLIEGKVIEATESFSRNLSNQISFNDRILFGSNGAASPTNLTGIASPAGGFSLGTITSIDRQRIDPGTGQLTGPSLALQNLLSISESKGLLKVVSSPKTVVMNRQMAKVLQTESVLIQQRSVVNGVETFTPTPIAGNIGLEVTPVVTNDGGVFMELKLDRDVANQLSAENGLVEKRNLQTKVLVDSGNTLVIGGVFTNRTNHIKAGIPFLYKLPVIGWLFGSDNKTENKSELIFFITPRILNPKEAGMRTS